MTRIILFLVLVEFMLIIPSHQSPRHGLPANLLHADNEKWSAKTISMDFDTFVHRSKRDLKTGPGEASASPSTKNTPLTSVTSAKKPMSTVNVTTTTTNKITTVVSNDINLFS